VNIQFLSAKDVCTLPEKWSIPLSLGFSVIPVEPNGKKPLGEWKAFMTRAAESDTVARWAANNNCNVGVVTGQVSGGLVVPDFDKPAAEEEAKRRGLPDTMTVRTGRGRHYYFKCPTGRTPRKPKGFPPGMDLQWNGKFVVAPGSIHPDGSMYEWENHPDIYDLSNSALLGAHVISLPGGPDKHPRVNCSKWRLSWQRSSLLPHPSC
jgi:hypothetical protein